MIHCMSYIELNMVRAGVVQHSSECSFSGYNEIENGDMTRLGFIKSGSCTRNKRNDKRRSVGAPSPTIKDRDRVPG